MRHSAINLDVDACTSCMICARAIDWGLCMYCGMCIESCPFDALSWSDKRVSESLSRTDLVSAWGLDGDR